MIDVLNRAAESCAVRGVKLYYHNHDWEFADDEESKFFVTSLIGSRHAGVTIISRSVGRGPARARLLAVLLVHLLAHAPYRIRARCLDDTTLWECIDASRSTYS